MRVYYYGAPCNVSTGCNTLILLVRVLLPLQGLYILDLLKESIQLENARISPIIAVFIAKTLQNIPGNSFHIFMLHYIWFSMQILL